MANVGEPSSAMPSKPSPRLEPLSPPISSSSDHRMVMPAVSTDMECQPSKKGGEENNQDGTSYNMDDSGQPPAPIDISIGQDEATKIMEASRAFNKALQLLQQDEDLLSPSKLARTPKTKHQDYDKGTNITNEKQYIENKSGKDLSEETEEENAAKVIDHTVNNSNENKTHVEEALSGQTVDQDENESKLSNHLLIRAAENCNNPLVKSFLKFIKKSGKESQEIQICLLLFVDMDKSSKLISGFEIAATSMSAETSASNLAIESAIKSEQDDTNVIDTIDHESTGIEQKSSKKRKLGLEVPDEAPSTKIEKTSEDDDERKSATQRDDHSTKKKLLEQNDENISSKEDAEVSKPELILKRKELISLFECFLTSILCCIQDSSEREEPSPSMSFDNDTNLSSTPKAPVPSKISSAVSPDNDSDSHLDGVCTLSASKKKEIHSLVVYATEQLQRYTLNSHETRGDDTIPATEPNTTKSLESVVVSFESFGDWYNSGGFGLMPWLELLDLVKWESLGKSTLELETKIDENVSEEENKPHSGGRVVDNSTKSDILEEVTTAPTKQDVTKSPPKPLNNTKEDSHPPENEVSDSAQALQKVSSSQHLNVDSSGSSSLSMDKQKPLAPSSTELSSKAPIHHSSRSIVSFDFTSSMPAYYNSSNQPFCIDITEENLKMLKELVTRTGLSSKSPSEVCDILLRHSYHDQMDRTSFVNCVRELFPAAMNFGQFHQSELVTFSNLFNTFFSCFDRDGRNVVNVRELAVGFSFLCDGNKSKKLAVSFELLDLNRKGYLSANSLTQYLRSYLTMLVGISYLSKNMSTNSDKECARLEKKRADMIVAVDSGAQRTQGHVLKNVNAHKIRMDHRTRADENCVTFEEFAEWYTVGGYTVAPWLELLDLNKFLSLLESSTDTDNYDPLATTAIGEPSSMSQPNPPMQPTNLSPHKQSSLPPSNPSGQYSRTSSKYSPSALPPPRQDKPNEFSTNLYPFSDSPGVAGQKRHDVSTSYQNETLFTFPLAHKDSLIVTREDAQYVYSVVDQLTLLSYEPEAVWVSLCKSVRLSSSNPSSRGHDSKQPMKIDQPTFIGAMKDLINRTGKKRIDQQTTLTLKDFHQSFDLRREGYVYLNQLMGGLTLLCGGRKSAKLSFAFGLFNSRNNNHFYPEERRMDSGKNDVALDRHDLYTFLRSFLIVLFSSCGQSLDMTPDKVGRHISDTSQMVCNDVMKHQWHTRRTEWVNFDDFGEWYNEGGFEIAPWLELLDLNKWVLLDSSKQGHPKYDDKENKNLNYSDQNVHDPYSRYDLNSSRSSRKNDVYNQHQSNAHNDGNNQRSSSRSHHTHKREKEFYEGNYRAERSSSHKNNPSSTFHDHHHKQSTPFKGNAGQGTNEQNDHNALKFNLLTSDDHKGLIVSIAQHRVAQLRHLVVESGLYRMDTSIVCNRILDSAVRSSDKSDGRSMVIRKDSLDHIIRRMIDFCSKEHTLSPDLQRSMSDTFMLIFQTFMRDRRGVVDANEFACGFSILCGGRKSDKLEYAFDLLDEDKDGKLSHRGMFKYLRAFLTAVMGLSVSSFGRTFSQGEQLMSMDGKYDRNASITDAIDAGAAWATDQVFRIDDVRGNRSRGAHWRSDVSFDDFAEWYTRGGYSSIPWLELLDLRKWVLVQS